MSMISSFLISHLIPSLESAFVAHEPEAQAALLAEAQVLASKVGEWVISKDPGKPQVVSAQTPL